MNAVGVDPWLAAKSSAGGAGNESQSAAASNLLIKKDKEIRTLQLAVDELTRRLQGESKRVLELVETVGRLQRGEEALLDQVAALKDENTELLEANSDQMRSIVNVNFNLREQCRKQEEMLAHEQAKGRKNRARLTEIITELRLVEGERDKALRKVGLLEATIKQSKKNRGHRKQHHRSHRQRSRSRSGEAAGRRRAAAPANAVAQPVVEPRATPDMSDMSEDMLSELNTEARESLLQIQKGLRDQLTKAYSSPKNAKPAKRPNAQPGAQPGAQPEAQPAPKKRVPAGPTSEPRSASPEPELAPPSSPPPKQASPIAGFEVSSHLRSFGGAGGGDQAKKDNAGAEMVFTPGGTAR